MAFSPKAAADACLARSRRFLALSERGLPVADVTDDLCRSALVAVVAAIDTYMHWVVFNRLSSVRYRSELPKSLARIEVPFADLATLADSAISAQGDKRRIRPWVQVKNTLQAQLLQQTFQSYEQVSSAFALAGVEKAWSKIGQRLATQPGAIKTRLNGMVHRRNQIVHEGDITRASRPRDIYFNEIEHDQVSRDINWVEQLVAAMQAVIDAE